VSISQNMFRNQHSSYFHLGIHQNHIVNPVMAAYPRMQNASPKYDSI